MKQLRNRTARMSIAGILCTLPMVIFASSDSYMDYARVVSVEPLTKIVRVSTPRTECWDETVSVRQAPRKSYTAEIMGSILGAAVGRQFGHGRGQDVATVAGAVLGSSIGHDVKRQYGTGRGAYQTVEERCETVTDVHTEEKIVGYDVTYRYQGRVYTTHMDQEPSDQIQVRVAVSPIY